jgi:hypothetical protein
LEGLSQNPAKKKNQEGTEKGRIGVERMGREGVEGMRRKGGWVSDREIRKEKERLIKKGGSERKRCPA